MSDLTQETIEAKMCRKAITANVFSATAGRSIAANMLQEQAEPINKGKETRMHNSSKPSMLVAIVIAIICGHAVSLQAAPEVGAPVEQKQSNKKKQKKNGWSFTANPDLPNVLILGDSISIGYTRQVRELLKGKANVYRPMNADGKRPMNCNGTMVGLQCCEKLLKSHRWDVIHFNWGLHDLKHVEKAHSNKRSNDPKSPVQSNSQEYKANLTKIVSALQETKAQLIFATTTPVVAGTVNPLRSPEAPIEYNEVATKIMADNGIQVNDLYAHALPHLADWQLPKDVHFNAKGSLGIAKKVATVISDKLATN